MGPTRWDDWSDDDGPYGSPPITRGCLWLLVGCLLFWVAVVALIAAALTR